MKSEYVITSRRPNFLKRLVASFILTLMVFLFVFFTKQTRYVALDNAAGIIVFALIICFAIFMVGASFVIQHAIHFNFSQKKITHEFLLGPIKYKESWQDLIEMNYISVFPKRGYFQVNLWYKKNQIVNLMTVKDKEIALEMGRFFSKNLEIELLDATEPNNYKWIDI